MEGEPGEQVRCALLHPHLPGALTCFSKDGRACRSRADEGIGRCTRLHLQPGPAHRDAADRRVEINGHGGNARQCRAEAGGHGGGRDQPGSPKADLLRRVRAKAGRRR